MIIAKATAKLFEKADSDELDISKYTKANICDK